MDVYTVTVIPYLDDNVITVLISIEIDLTDIVLASLTTKLE